MTVKTAFDVTCVTISAVALSAGQINKARAKHAERKYNKQIAKSQAKIGPYVPAVIPVMVWA